MASILSKAHRERYSNAAEGAETSGVDQSTIAASASRAAYETPDSSVSPGPDGRRNQRLAAHARSGSGSGDDSDDFYMDGIDNGTERVESGVADSSPYMDAQGSRNYEEDPDLAPATLAETYLPLLFAQHGPCAIRHLTQYLSVNNPKFGDLNASKQRRLVVKALELKRGILFEKVGWGRWNQIDLKPADGVPFTPESMPQDMGKSGSLLSSSLKQSVRAANSVGNQKPPIMGSYPISSLSSHHEFMFSPSLSVAETNRDDEDDGDIDPLDLDMEGEDSDTDEEDWKTMGAEALRARHANSSAVGSYRESGSFTNSYSGSLRSMPYPIRRKSSAGVYQMNSPHLQPGSFSNSPISRPSFPKTSSYLKASPISNARASSFARPRDARQQTSPTRAPVDHKSALIESGVGDHADAVQALVMLSGGQAA